MKKLSLFPSPLIATISALSLMTFIATAAVVDSDGDGVNDYLEGKDGTDPTDARSFNPLSKGLVAFYPFNTNANDESGYARNGNLVGASEFTPDRKGNKNASLGLQESGVMTVSPTPFSVNGNYTISIWIYGDPSGTQSVQQILATAPDSQGGIILRYHTPEFTFEGWGYSSGWYGQDSPSPSWGGVVNGAALFRSQWNHVLITKTGKQTAFYINGIQRSRISPTPVTVDSGTIYFGEYQYSFEGSLDDIRIYDRGVSASQAAQLYYAEAFDQPRRAFLARNPWIIRAR